MNALLRLPAYDMALLEALDTVSRPLGVKAHLFVRQICCPGLVQRNGCFLNRCERIANRSQTLEEEMRKSSASSHGASLCKNA